MKIELTLLALILKAATEAVLTMIKANLNEIKIQPEVAVFLSMLLGVHPEPEVGNFYRHELEELQ